jgi:predicted dehydrogenase
MLLLYDELCKLFAQERISYIVPSVVCGDECNSCNSFIVGLTIDHWIRVLAVETAHTQRRMATSTIPESSRVTGFGILGTSKIAHDFVTAIAGHQQLGVVAVGSRSLERAQLFADEHRHLFVSSDSRSVNVNVHGSYEELVADPAVDVIYVSTSTIDHYEHALLALQHGKDVLCEKAFTINAAQLRHLIATAKQTKNSRHTSRCCFLMEANWMVYWPLIQYTVNLVCNQKSLGEIRLIQADLGFNCPDSKIYDPRYGGGSLLAVGMYCVTLAHLLCGGRPDAIVSQCAFGDDIAIVGRDGQAKTVAAADKTCSALLRYPSGASAVLTGTVEANTPSAGISAVNYSSLSLWLM